MEPAHSGDWSAINAITHKHEGPESACLTEEEFGVIAYLYDHEDKVVSRSALLNHVWGHEYEGGSNVVDVRVRGLRKKPGSFASSIETVSISQ